MVWDEDSKTWGVLMNPEIKGLPRIDHVVYTTGVQADFRSLPEIQPLLAKIDVRCVGGLPCLTQHLMWSEDVPLFVPARLASLRLGPGARKLEVARTGTERVVWKVGKLFRQWHGVRPGREIDDEGHFEYESAGEVGEVHSRRIGLGTENQFALLWTDGGSESR